MQAGVLSRLTWQRRKRSETAAKSERRRREVGAQGKGGRGGERGGRERGSTPLSTYRHLAIGLLHAPRLFFFAPPISVPINARGNSVHRHPPTSLSRRPADPSFFFVTRALCRQTAHKSCVWFGPYSYAIAPPESLRAARSVLARGACSLPLFPVGTAEPLDLCVRSHFTNGYYAGP